MSFPQHPFAIRFLCATIRELQDNSKKYDNKGVSIGDKFTRANWKR